MMDMDSKENKVTNRAMNVLQGQCEAYMLEYQQVHFFIFGHTNRVTPNEFMKAYKSVPTEVLKYFVSLKSRLLKARAALLTITSDALHLHTGQYTYICDASQDRFYYFDNEEACIAHSMQHATSHPRVVHRWRVGDETEVPLSDADTFKLCLSLRNLHDMCSQLSLLQV